VRSYERELPHRSLGFPVFCHSIVTGAASRGRVAASLSPDAAPMLNEDAMVRST